jgi:hypothetical protein
MKYSLLVLALLTSSLLFAQEHKLEKLWETDAVLAVPESVLPDSKKNVLYISLIDGPSWEADGKGGIGRLDPSGKNYDSSWISGLDAPKGMGMLGNRLYVADMGAVIVIDIQAGKIEKRIAIDSAKGLNDITISDANIIYVSDSRTGRIWRIENDMPTLYMDTVRGVNGLKAIGDDLYIGAGKNFIKADRNKNITKIAEVPQGIDGIEPIGNGDFLLTAWGGYIWYVSGNGKVETLLESHVEKKNTADIGYDPEKRIMYVPTFNAKTVTAYLVK